MAHEDEAGVRYDRRGMLLRMGASGIAVAVPAACGSDGEKSNTESTDPIVSDSTGSATTSAAPPVSSPPAASTSAAPPPASSPVMQPTQTPATASSSAPPTPATSQAPTAETPATTSAAPTTEPEDTAPDTSETTDPSTTASAEGSGGSGGAPAENTGGAGGETAAPPSGDLTPPAWDDVPMCTASKTDGAGQGPFFIHNLEKDDDIDLFRQDIRGKYNPDAEDGIEMQLHLRILDAKSTDCNGTPVPDVEIYIWNTDGQGFYSGFGNPGDQKPDDPYMGVPGQNDLDVPERFCRGAQVTNADGVVSFRSIYPGFYNGRDVHIHFVALKKGTMSRGRVSYSGMGHLFTTQFYFDPEFTRTVHMSAEPYKRRTMNSAWEGAIAADEGGNSGLHAKATFEGGIVVAQMQILLDPAGT